MTTHKDDPKSHSGPAAHVKETTPPKNPPNPNMPKGDPAKGPQASAQTDARGGGAPRDPMGSTEPFRRETETLPVVPHPEGKGEPVGHARHAESPEEVEKINYMEGRDSKVPPIGSRNYVAGQPVDDEEYERTEAEANRLAAAGKEQRTEAEKRIADANLGDPNYHPADPDHRDPQAGGKKGD